MTVVYYKVHYLPGGVRIWFRSNCRVGVFVNMANLRRYWKVCILWVVASIIQSLRLHFFIYNLGDHEVVEWWRFRRGQARDGVPLQSEGGGFGDSVDTVEEQLHHRHQLLQVRPDPRLRGGRRQAQASYSYLTVQFTERSPLYTAHFLVWCTWGSYELAAGRLHQTSSESKIWLQFKCLTPI